MSKKFVDTAKIQIKAGHGGRGVVSFRREKYVPKGGPDGGAGGKGGSIILEPTDNIQTLLDLKFRKVFQAESGWPGQGKNKTGKSGKDTIIKLPKGTLIFDQHNEIIVDLIDEPYVIAHGGKGGAGNSCFATSTNRTPRYSQPGLPGEELEVTLELRLIAEVGIIGLPNAGKSTLLQSLTNAHPKIASYPFTTLYPNLGMLKLYDREIVIADIPGIIEGASHGAGLGDEFLRHVDRTKFLIHLIAVTPEDPDQCLKDYEIIQEELKLSTLDLQEKKQIVVLNKIDLIAEKELKYFIKLFKKKKIVPLAISAYTGNGVDSLKAQISEEINAEKKDSAK